MGVYIKNMEMPRDCPMCPLAHYNRLDLFTGCDIVSGRRYAMQDETYAQSSVRPDWCPLIEIPEAKVPAKCMRYLSAKSFLLSRRFTMFCKWSGKDIYNYLIEEKKQKEAETND